MNVIKYYTRLIFYITPKLASELSDRRFFRSVVKTFDLWFFLVSRKSFLRGKEKRFDLTYKNKEFSLVLKSAIDVAVLGEVFVLKEYEWNVGFEPKSILDLGAHWGDSAIYYALKYPEAKITSVEPSSDIFGRLKEQTRQFSNISTVQGGLDSQTGTAKLYVGANSLGSSFTERSGQNEAVVVKTYTMQDLCRLAGVERFDIVKFDIEGAEEKIFQDEKIKKLGRAFIGEIHLDLMDLTLKQIKNYFSDFHLSISRISKMRYIIRAIKK